jgi:hypothetical protein
MHAKLKKCLYLIKCRQTNLIKIGITNDWETRAKALKINTKTVPLFLVITSDNIKAEKNLHKIFETYRLPGSEYFALNAAQVQEAVNIARTYGDVFYAFKPCLIVELSPAAKLLEQQYVEISHSFKTQMLRQLRLQLEQRGYCIFDFLHEWLNADEIKYLTVYLDTKVNQLKINNKRMTMCKDAYIRLRVIENTIDTFFKFYRVYFNVNTDIKSEYNLHNLIFTTVKINRIVKFKHLPLAFKSIFQRLWNRYDFAMDLHEIKKLLDGRDPAFYRWYTESYGPLVFSENQQLPIPDFSGTLKSG